jgi:ABC-type polysaccharide/polyol phosphate export permease
MKRKISLLIYFTRRDIQSRYAGSSLGLVWTFFLPLLQIGLFWFVFSLIMGARPYARTSVPYVYFLFSSFFFWLAFSEGLIRASWSVLENAELVKKVNFPYAILPIATTTSTYLHHIIGFVIFFIVYLFIKGLHTNYLFLIPVFSLQYLFSIGLGLLLASISPYIRDINQVLGYIMQGLFFLSPIIYSIEAMPEKLRFLILFNPVTYFISSYQNIILFNKAPTYFFIIMMTVLSAGTFMLGFWAFRKLRVGFADIL